MVGNKSCGQVSIPKVDETNIDCHEFYSSQCVLKNNFIFKVLKDENISSLNDFFKELEFNLLVSKNKMKEQSLQIKTLIRNLEDLKQEVNSLRGELTEIKIKQIQ